jgi:hypothetical protein
MRGLGAGYRRVLKRASLAFARVVGPAHQETARAVRDGALQMAQLGIVLHCVSTYVGNMTASSGPSMLPTLNPSGDLLIVDAISPRLGRLAVGDVVIAQSPGEKAHTIIVKRIVGMAGDTVRIPSPSATYSRRITTSTPPSSSSSSSASSSSSSSASRMWGASLVDKGGDAAAHDAGVVAAASLVDVVVDTRARVVVPPGHVWLQVRLAFTLERAYRHTHAYTQDCIDA